MVDVSIDRRSFFAAVAGGLAATGLAARPQNPVPGTRRFIYVGSYTTPERGHGDGITVFRNDAGRWTQIQVVKDLENPSFVIVDALGRCLYAVHGDGDRASAYRIDPVTGRLTLINNQPTGGKNGVHLSIDATGRHLVVANYDTGTLAVLPIGADGSLGELTDLVTLTGTPGPHKTQQVSSHPHDCPFDPSHRFIVVPDKGLDRVFVWSLDAAAGKLLPARSPSVAARAGSGPRHVDFHPTLPFAYVINELDSTVTTYRMDRTTGGLTPVQILPSIPPTYTADNTAAEIAVARSGRFVYGSNRGHDSIVIFAVDPAQGTLRAIGWESTRGSTPRFFGFDPSGAHLYAANQASDNIVGFDVNLNTGLPTPTGNVVKVGAPSAIAFSAL